MAIRCLIVDDHQPFLDAAGILLGREGIEIVGVAANASEAIRQAEALQPDVVLVDVFLGEESGIELARRLVEHAPSVIMISSHTADDVADLIGGGRAAGFITKEELSAAAIRHVLDVSERRDT